MTADVIVIGDALIDELRDERSVREFVGGAALNVAVGLARLGHSVALIAMVGDDADGDRVRTYLQTFGVSLIATRSPLGTARAVSERVNGEPTYAFNNASRRRSIVFGDAERAAIAAARGVVVSCMALDDPAQVDGLRAALDGSDADLFIDPNPRAGMMRDLDEFVRGFDRLLARAKLVKVGDDDTELLYGSGVEPVRGWLRERGIPVVVSTRGRGGARVDTADAVVERGIAHMPGQVVDTMGAGDAVLAAMVSWVLTAPEPIDWAAGLERAMDVAAATVRHEGALLQIPAQPGESYDKIET
ncbi:PfkB family carbohydrate kinase [Microbacterium sp. NC79]|uniref:PfkB family carbohydrate kinase n=1 Tax=Microbacterium sp. NC79 TaxID=2851009 RepID=UPI001C2C6251|nr:PfkB family carbohydrate kinase [Microbacterium sp. NC79]MBV0895645.1 hypothetical protein [Microbacterium sp. NC79]